LRGIDFIAHFLFKFPCDFNIFTKSVVDLTSLTLTGFTFTCTHLRKSTGIHN